jgi:drug/metabolite transporter (DMT)-like permease
MILFGVVATILFGLKTTSTSNAGFLVGLTVIFTPLLNRIMFHKKLEQSKLFGVVLAIAGIALLTLNNELSMHPGDILCIAGGILNALYILVSGEVVKKTDSISVGLLSLGFTAIYGLIFSLLFESPTLPQTLDGWVAILALSVICGAFCFIAQSIALQYIKPVQLGIMYALEPLFAAIFAFSFAGERLTMQGYFGALLVITGILTSEWLEHRKKHRKATTYVMAPSNLGSGNMATGVKHE